MPSILAVDDSPSMRKMVAFTLTGAGYHVVEAVDGQDALEKADTHEIDLVLADQNMPRLDGIGLTRKLREHPKFKGTPILILTTESSEQMKFSPRPSTSNDTTEVSEITMGRTFRLCGATGVITKLPESGKMTGPPQLRE